MQTQHDNPGHGAGQDGNGRMQADLRKGIQGYFDVDGITIGVWGSAWSGREVITVDDRVVSDKRSWRFSTPHHFEHAGIRYKLVFTVTSLIRGEIRTELYREGVLIDSDRVRQNAYGIDPETGRFSWWRMARALAPFFIGGMAFGAGIAWLSDFLAGG